MAAAVAIAIAAIAIAAIAVAAIAVAAIAIAAIAVAAIAVAAIAVAAIAVAVAIAVNLEMKVDPISDKPIIPIRTLAAICCSKGGKLVKSTALHYNRKKFHLSNTLCYRQVDVRLLNLLT